MPMFDLEDVGKADLKRCETKGSDLVRGRRIKVFEAEDCKAERPITAMSEANEPIKPLWKRALRFLLGHAITITSTVIAAAIIAYFGFS